MSFSHSKRRKRSRPAYAFMAALAAAALIPPPAAAQDTPEAGQPQAARPAAKAQGSDLAGRIGRLEEKVGALQVMIGTLESFISTKPAVTLPQESSPPAQQAQGTQGNLTPRIEALETQIAALTSHIEQLGRQLSALEAKLGASSPSAPAPLPVPPGEPSQPLPQQGQALPPSDSATASIAQAQQESFDPSKPRWYGPKPGSDALASLLEEETAKKRPSDSMPQSLTAAVPGGDAQSLYQQGYGALLQKDYAGAETAFRQLLDTYPNDPLAGDAQYWIGETYHVRGQYKSAADAFLDGYKKYKGGQKGPDTLLKLGMSLAELGQKEAACSTFDELKAKFPQAPDDISEEAKVWRKKAGC